MRAARCIKWLTTDRAHVAEVPASDGLWHFVPGTPAALTAGRPVAGFI